MSRKISMKAAKRAAKKFYEKGHKLKSEALKYERRSAAFFRTFRDNFFN